MTPPTDRPLKHSECDEFYGMAEPTQKRPEPVDLDALKGISQGEWEIHEAFECSPAEGHPEHGIPDLRLISVPECRNVAQIERVYNGGRNLVMEKAHALAIAQVPALITDLKATRERESQLLKVVEEACDIATRWHQESTFGKPSKTIHFNEALKVGLQARTLLAELGGDV